MKLIFFFIRFGLGALLLWSGLVKARQPYEFLAAVYAYQLVGPTPGLLLAALIPWLEIVVGCCLVGGVLVEGALLATVALTSSFTLAIASAWHRGLGISCGCFGTGHASIDGLTVLRSLGLLLISVLGLVAALRSGQGRRVQRINRQRKRGSPKSPPRGSRFLSPITAGEPVHSAVREVELSRVLFWGRIRSLLARACLDRRG